MSCEHTNTIWQQVDYREPPPAHQTRFSCRRRLACRRRRTVTHLLPNSVCVCSQDKDHISSSLCISFRTSARCRSECNVQGRMRCARTRLSAMRICDVQGRNSVRCARAKLNAMCKEECTHRTTLVKQSSNYKRLTQHTKVKKKRTSGQASPA